jgi:hypothetical protein
MPRPGPFSGRRCRMNGSLRAGDPHRAPRLERRGSMKSTAKVHTSESIRLEDGGWEHSRSTLKPRALTLILLHQGYPLRRPASDPSRPPGARRPLPRRAEPQRAREPGAGAGLAPIIEAALREDRPVS